MSMDNLIKLQVNEALAPVLDQMQCLIAQFVKADEYKNIRISTAEVARLLGKTPATITNYVDREQLNPVDRQSKYYLFTLEEIERFKVERNKS